MGEVIDILAKQPHCQGPAICLHCKHEWVAVAPVGVSQMECSNCGLMKGVFKNLCAPDGKLWHCSCGNPMFYITETHAFCTFCGLAQAF